MGDGERTEVSRLQVTINCTLTAAAAGEISFINWATAVEALIR